MSTDWLIKRYLPYGYFDLLVMVEGNEYKNDGSAQGQAMGVLANKGHEVLLLSGKLMGGYADDLFFLLWRIGQSAPVDVYFLGYVGSAQIACLSLMARKIAVSQSTSGDMPDTGLDVLNQDGDSIEVALARKLVS